MAFAAVGSLGSSFEKVSDTSFSITVGATAEVGNVVVVFAACDNIGTTEAESDELTISDSAGNTWSKKEYRFSAGAAGDGVTGIIAWSKLTSQLTSGAGTITVTASSAITTKLLAAYEFTMGSGTLTLETQLFDGAAASDPISMSFSGLPSREYLFISGVFSEGGTTHTTDADYTEIFDTETTGGSVASNTALLGAYRIATETGNTIDHSSTNDRDHVQIAVALYEAAAGTTHNAASAMTLVMAFATIATKLVLAASAMTAVFAFASAATRTARVSSAATFSFGRTTSATRTTFASSAHTYTFGFATSATRAAFVASSSTHMFGFATSATRTAFGSSALPVVFGFSSSAGGAVSVASSLNLDLAFASQATRTATVASAATYTVGIVTAARLDAHAASALPIVFAATTSATKATTVASALPIVFGFTTIATGPSVITHPAGRPGFIADYGRGRIDRTLVGRIT